MFEYDDLFYHPDDDVVEAAYADLEPAADLPSLDDIEPGPVLAALLASIDVASLTPDQQVAVMRAEQRMASHFSARVYRSMAAVSDSVDEIEDDPQLAAESAAAEVRAALNLTRRAADIEIGFAHQLRARLPLVWAMLSAGDVDVRRARVLANGTSHLSVARARQVTRRLLDEAPRLTTGQLAARLRRLCAEVDPGGARHRYRQAVARRRVYSDPTTDGTAHLLALDLPPARVAAVMHRINRMARSLRRAGETRTMDQLRADVFLDLLAGRSDGAGGVVDIRVDLDTLARLVDHPGDLAGYGPVVADIARQVAEGQRRGEWRFAVTLGETGEPVAGGTTRRRPTAGQRREVEQRDSRCVFPGCRMPATDCDLDHQVPHGEGGPTRVSNLAPLCRHDHRIRHAGWTYRRRESGEYEWTSRLGRSYVTKPP